MLYFSRTAQLKRTSWALLALPLLLGACDDPYGPLCVAFCHDSTRLQREYVESRDECRQLAELKFDTMQPMNEDGEQALDRNAKSKLVGMFSECMGNKDWSVPGPAKDDKKATAAPAAGAPAAAPVVPAPVSDKALEAERRKTADCAFARQAADASIIAKKRAQACDIECENIRRLAPDGPKPAACR